MSAARSGPRASSALDPAIAARLKRDPDGLFPAVAQQYDTGEVLMVGWMDDEALHRTLTTGRCTYWSRSRQEYWVKGDTSGHQQWVKSVALDCDGDTVLVRVDQVGAACHTGDRTCFDADRLEVVTGAPPGAGPAGGDGLMVSGAVTPDRDSFRSLAARYTVVPVTRRLLADAETPVGVYRKLGGGQGTFLLESAEHGRSWSRYSFVGVRSAATLTERDGRAVWTEGAPPPGVPATGEPFEVLRAAEAALTSPRYPGDPPLLGGLVGYLSYDIVRRLERIGDHAVDDLGLPELRLLLCTDLAVLDHDDGSCLLVANAFTPGAHPATWRAVDAAYEEAARPAGPDDRRPGQALPADRRRPRSDGARGNDHPDARSRTEPGGYQRAVRAAIEEIRAGEAFQIVVSQRFETTTAASPLDVYRVLRSSNPSPYMYLLRFHDHDVVGSSPESHVTVTGRRARLHPIAGTRPRGATPEDDARLAAELLADPKERAEHVMLVDLGRNDLGRVCAPGSVTVVEFGAVERYSHVMHIVSTVVGDVAEGRDALDVLAATFPAGTLTGAPKPRAMQIIDELEPTRRGLYGGVVGYLDFGGDLDTAIAIRTAVLRDGRAYVQAGAGIVADSDPDTEYQESVNKATVVLRAISLAGTLRPAGPGDNAAADAAAATADATDLPPTRPTAPPPTRPPVPQGSRHDRRPARPRARSGARAAPAHGGEARLDDGTPAGDVGRRPGRPARREPRGCRRVDDLADRPNLDH